MWWHNIKARSEEIKLKIPTLESYTVDGKPTDKTLLRSSLFEPFLAWLTPFGINIKLTDELTYILNLQSHDEKPPKFLGNDSDDEPENIMNTKMKEEPKEQEQLMLDSRRGSPFNI